MWRIDSLPFHKKRRVASDTETAVRVLDYLANDHNPLIREAVAANTGSSQETIRMLAKDRYAIVRAAAAGNVDKVSDVSLVVLAFDKEKLVRDTVMRSARIPADLRLALGSLAKEDAERGVRKERHMEPFDEQNHERTAEDNVRLAGMRTAAGRIGQFTNYHHAAINYIIAAGKSKKRNNGTDMEIYLQKALESIVLFYGNEQVELEDPLRNLAKTTMTMNVADECLEAVSRWSTEESICRFSGNANIVAREFASNIGFEIVVRDLVRRHRNG